MDMLSEIMEMAQLIYDKQTYYHAMRVCAYVSGNNIIPKDRLEKCVVLAVIHDLPPNTGFNYYNNFYKIFDSDEKTLYIYRCFEILAKNEKDTYEDYIKNIKKHCHLYPEIYYVAMADIKDHLIQKEIPDKEKEKYLMALLQLA